MKYSDDPTKRIEQVFQENQDKMREQREQQEAEAERRLAEKVAELDRRRNILITLKMLQELRAQGVVTLAGRGGAVETLKGML